MIEFHNTVLGRHFYEHDVPALIKAINDLAKELRRFNDANDYAKHKSLEDSDHA